jgi:hypothetical protein
VHAILKLLVAKDPTMEMIPLQEDQETFTDLLKFPANKEAYNQRFDHHAVQNQPTEARKMLIAHSLITNTKFTNLKFQNPALMDYMYKHKIWLKLNQSESLEISALGFIQDVHPRATYRDDYRYNLEEAVHLEMTDTEREKIKEALPASKKRDNDGELLKPTSQTYHGDTIRHNKPRSSHPTTPNRHRAWQARSRSPKIPWPSSAQT